ncbi:MAG: tRNA (guanine-N(1)-)-methyltransferase [Alphaproteobacteria bacterium MarineAlpha6_Bin2]|nr:MAG: tRNA (guanine-N(1)-)-methyltransferase [Alphaproteobacteria bacterium MarineAlpha6_Bin2]
MKSTTKHWSVNILTLFPEMFPGPLNFSLVGKALKEKIWSLNLVDLRDFAENGPKSVDDKPYGGGPGMIIKSEVIDNALKKVTKKIKQYSLIYLTPKGKKINQKKIKELVKKDNLILLCGKYEGIDQRVIENWSMEELSIGDFVLSGGEIAAMSLLDSCIRLLPGVVGSSETLKHETFENNLLEYPQYTKPSNWKGRKVPEILLSGNHQKIEEWRKKKSFEITKLKRPDLFKK